MARIDKIREEIGWLKLVFGVLVAIDVSLIAWLAQNHLRAAPILLAAGAFSALMLTGVIISTVRTIYHLIDELEDS